MYPGVQMPVIPDEPDDSTLVVWWEGLGEETWRRVVECVGLSGGLSVTRLRTSRIFDDKRDMSARMLFIPLGGFPFFGC